MISRRSSAAPEEEQATFLSLPVMDELLALWSAEARQPLPGGAGARLPVRPPGAENVPAAARPEVLDGDSLEGPSIPAVERGSDTIITSPEPTGESVPIPAPRAGDAVFLNTHPARWEHSLPFLAVAAGWLGLWLRDPATVPGMRPNGREPKREERGTPEADSNHD